MAGMQRRHFETIAKIIHDAKADAMTIGNADTKESVLVSVRNIADDMSRELAVYNEQFDRARFLKSCGFGD